MCPPDGDWQLQVLPGAPGTARQGPTRIIMLVNDGGVATQPRAPGHDRPRAASSDAARHGRPRATPRAPGADVPPAIAAGAPGQHRLRAVPQVLDHARSDARHQRAPGHDRPLAASSDVERHDRPRATLRAPGADVPLATTAGAPGQHRLRAAQRTQDHFRSCSVPTAPGHGRPLAASSDVERHDRPCATPMAPGADVPLASTAGAPGQHRPRAVAIATVALPAGLRRLRQEGLPHNPANPRTHQDTAQHRAAFSHTSRYTQSRASSNPPLSTWWRGAGGEDRHLPPLSSGRSQPTHQVHPAIQVPPQPRSCSTAHTGFFAQHPSRAPPPSRHCGAGRNPGPCIAPGHRADSPSLQGGGRGVGPPSTPTWWRRGRVMGQRRTTPGTIRAALARQRVRAAPQRRDWKAGRAP